MSKKSLIISLHDFHPGSKNLIAEQVDFLGGLGVKNFSILVVPCYHHGKRTKESPASIDFLQQRHEAGDDLVLHGYYHDRSGMAEGNLFFTRFYTENEAECLDLSDGELSHRLELGRQFWNERGWPLHGFIAPAWLLPRHQDAVLKRQGFEYTTRLGHISLVQKGLIRKSQSLCYSTRSAWRRTLSLTWNPVLFSRLRKTDTVRLSLHPNDLTFPQVRLQIKEIVEMALAEGYQPLTYRDYGQV